MKDFLADGKTIDHKRDGKTPKQRTAAAKKAARTRRENKPDQTIIHLKIDNKLLDGLEKLEKIGGVSSRNEAILTALRQYLIQLRMLN
tara:strand:+ start:708 stop:971 length:264 start_codon:yes stop_codon:yes gene_type:complete